MAPFALGMTRSVYGGASSRSIEPALSDSARMVESKMDLVMKKSFYVS